jgi:hypothetical protein
MGFLPISLWSDHDPIPIAARKDQVNVHGKGHIFMQDKSKDRG